MIYAVCCAALLPIGCAKQPAPDSDPVPPVSADNRIGFDISSLQTRGNTVLHRDSILSLSIFGYSTDYDAAVPTGTPLAGGNLTAAPALLNNQKAERTFDGMSLSDWGTSQWRTGLWIWRCAIHSSPTHHIRPTYPQAPSCRFRR